MLTASCKSAPPAPALLPDQVARGREIFVQRCQPCHGDKGQGLALWRLTWAPEDQNCAQTKCHGGGHPPDGFSMPLDAPAIIGDNTLTDFQTAADLFGYVSRRMPFDKPGELAADDYWAVVAYLLAERGTPPGSAGLNAKNAGSVPVK